MHFNILLSSILSLTTRTLSWIHSRSTSQIKKELQKMFTTPANIQDRFPQSSHSLPRKNTKMEYSSSDSKKAGGIPSLISMMAVQSIQTPSSSSSLSAQHKKMFDNTSLLAALDDVLDIASSPSRFDESPIQCRKTRGILNSMVPVRKPERLPSCESLTSEVGPRVPAHQQQQQQQVVSTANAVFDTIAPPLTSLNRGQSFDFALSKPTRKSSCENLVLLRRETSVPGDMALSKPSRKASCENLIELYRRSKERHSSYDTLIGNMCA